MPSTIVIIMVCSMTASDGGFNRSMQHTMIRASGRSVADALPDKNLLHRPPEGIDVGAVEGRWTLHQIGHLFDRPHTSIQNILSGTGGIRPPERCRSLVALSLGEG